MLLSLSNMGKTIISRSEIPLACDERFAPIQSQTLASWRRLGIVRSGISRVVPGYHMGRLAATQHMLILTTAGAGYAHSEVDDWRLSPGTLFMSRADAPIAFGCADDEWRMYWWYADARQAVSDPYVYRTCDNTAILAAAMESLFKETGDVPREQEWSAHEETGDKARAHLLAELIAHYLADELLGAPSVSLDSRAQQLQVLWRSVERNLHKDWSLNDFADFLQVSAATVQRWMHQYYGKSCHQCLIDRRMRRASELLQQTDYRLSAIAEQLGYCDAFTFSNAFKQHFKKAPRRFRQELAEH